LYSNLKKHRQMKNLINIQKGSLNEFGNFFQNVEFSNQGAQDVLELIKTEIKNEIEDIQDSPEFWWAEFKDPYDGKNYIIAADGGATSSGKYVVAEIDEA
jgi:hypothetical protein